MGYMTLSLFMVGCSNQPSVKPVETLKDAFKEEFYIGTALNSDQIWGRDTLANQVLKTHFNSIVAENCMKSELLQPQQGVFDFKDADQFIELGMRNNMHIIGHTLIWHSQAPSWFFIDDKGKDVSREVLIERMRDHITTVVTRYKGRVKGWDVVNEAVEDDGSLRNSKFLQIIGEDYLRLAFEFAQAADPDADLYYNDYSMAKPTKRAGVVRMIEHIVKQGGKISGIGMQGHIGLDYPDINDFEESIKAFYAVSKNVMITELDINVLPMPKGNQGAEVSLSYEYQQEMNPYAAGLPEEVQARFDQRYIDFFTLFEKHKEKISRVTLWGISDANSWLNDWPVKGRTNYSLLFDRNYDPKPVMEEVIKIGYKN